MKLPPVPPIDEAHDYPFIEWHADGTPVFILITYEPDPNSPECTLPGEGENEDGTRTIHVSRLYPVGTKFPVKEFHRKTYDELTQEDKLRIANRARFAWSCESDRREEAGTQTDPAVGFVITKEDGTELIHRYCRECAAAIDAWFNWARDTEWHGAVNSYWPNGVALTAAYWRDRNK